MNNIIILVGNIGSGKTTYCNTLTNYVVISRDALRYMIGNGKYIFDVNLESAIHQSEKYIVEEFMKTGRDIVIDEVGMSRKLRKPYIKLASKYQYKVTAIIMPKLTMQESVKRRLSSPHGDFGEEVWNSVWQRFNSIYQKPAILEGFDSIIYYGK